MWSDYTFHLYMAINSVQIVSVLRATEGGFSTGYLVVEGRQQFAGKYLHVAFQNENLVARTTESPAVDKEAKPHPGRESGGCCCIEQ